MEGPSARGPGSRYMWRTDEEERRSSTVNPGCLVPPLAPGYYWTPRACKPSSSIINVAPVPPEPEAVRTTGEPFNCP